MAASLALRAEYVQSLHHIQHDAQEHGVLHEAHRYAAQSVGQADEAYFVEGGGDDSGYAAQGYGGHNPQKEKGNQAGDDVHLRTSYGQILAQRTIAQAGNDKAGYEAQRAYKFTQQAMRPSLPNGIEQDNKNEYV